jgi:hypothetical protein
VDQPGQVDLAGGPRKSAFVDHLDEKRDIVEVCLSHLGVIRLCWRRGKPTLLALPLLLSACREAGTQPVASASPSATSAPSASASAPPAPPSPPRPALELGAEPIEAQPERRRVSIRSPALSVPEPLAEVRFPNTCSAYVGASGHWRVSCTPDHRRLLAVAERAGAELVLTLAPGSPKERTLRVPLAAEQPLGVVGVIEPRAAPCEPNGEQKPIKVAFRSNNFYPGHEKRSPFHLLVEGNRAVPLVDTFMWWQGCKHEVSDGVVSISCKGDTHAGRIWIEGQSVHFTWRDKDETHGVVLLPCDRKPELSAPECFNCNNAYF